MSKPTFIATSLAAAALFLAANTPAQQTPAASSPTTPPAAAKPATAAKPAQTPAAKTGAAAGAKTQAPLTLKTQKEKADIELQLAVEKRKMAFSQWQSRVFLQTAEESHLKSLAQDKDTKAIHEKIGQLEAKLKPLSTPAASTK